MYLEMITGNFVDKENFSAYLQINKRKGIIIKCKTINKKNKI